jgi:transcriptional regulator with XRE-family HTH domain
VSTGALRTPKNRCRWPRAQTETHTRLPDGKLDEDLVKRAFAVTLRLLRNHTGHSQSSLALETDMDSSFIQAMEYGESAPTVASLFRLARGLQVAPASMAAMTELYIHTVEDSTRGTPSPPEACQLLALMQHQPPGADANPRTISKALGAVVRRL